MVVNDVKAVSMAMGNHRQAERIKHEMYGDKLQVPMSCSFAP